MGNAKVSIIIPCYNRADFIVETVESVLNQTYQNIELIVVDDGCTDNSRDILEQFHDRITILEHPGRINKGQSAALNVGIAASDGEYIAFLDSDDVFAPEKIEKQLAYLEQHPEIGLVYANGHTIDAQGNKIYRIYGDDHQEHSDPNRMLLDCYFLLPNNSLLRRKLFDKSGQFEESFRSAQDHDLAIRIFEITKVGYLPECLFFYRRHKDSISHKSAMVRWKNGYKILNRARKRYPYRWSTIIGRLAVLNFRLGQCYREKNSYWAAIPLFLAAGICDPIRSFKVIVGHEKISSPH